MRRFALLLPLAAAPLLAVAARGMPLIESAMSATVGVLLIALVRREPRPFEAA